MVRSGFVVCVLATHALAQPGTTPPAPPPTFAPTPAPATAPARPDRGFVALGVVVGAGNNWLYGAYTGELAITIPGAPIRLRARLFGALIGGTIESDWGGDFSRWGGGLEARFCTRGRLSACAFGDLDVAYQKLTLYDDTNAFVRSDKGVAVGPRVGVDFGGAVRVGAALELYRMFAHHVSAKTDDRRSFSTGGFALHVGYQF